MKKILNIKYLPLFILLTFFSPAVFYSCTDDSVGENFYTFTGQTVTDFLEDDSEKFSDFIHVLKKAEMWGLLQTYGSFTCFSPTPVSFVDYLTHLGKSSIYIFSILYCYTFAQTLFFQTASSFTTYVTL